MIIDDLLLLPLRGLLAIAEKIDDAVRQELEDADYLRSKLLELQLSYELGDIEQEEYEESYRRLVERLQALERETEDNP
ncbi:gas vesicle protein GvpG [Thermacetogenium phaeum DSM 12270]|uniref:Gas vesicle protein GvpG n=1 Tax=Thermacetogenium phaeum (strain ATCC BAA-254 / DSM 26808 / PB) TaxID=1089553 RepID=K4LGV1_THEPS|nr:gas vesicle protein GvpG [Thermacetogenium phaeum]AFV11272.1 gas vesicle protein GvpG [Thermacetogenium phaeum DSM 12270]